MLTHLKSWQWCSTKQNKILETVQGPRSTLPVQGNKRSLVWCLWRVIQYDWPDVLLLTGMLKTWLVTPFFATVKIDGFCQCVYHPWSCSDIWNWKMIMKKSQNPLLSVNCLVTFEFLHINHITWFKSVNVCLRTLWKYWGNDSPL